MRRISFLLILLSLIMIALPAQAQESDIFTVPWRAEYFNNPYLAGTANVIRFDEGIGFEWGNQAPVTGVPDDNFSVRWGKGGDFPAGTYRFIVTASSGFRLYLDNDIILDTWEDDVEGLTIGRDIVIEAGYHNLQLDYYDAGGDAFIYLDWGFAPDGEVAPQSANITNGNTVTVTANVLNVRSEARIANNITTRITRGQQFTQIGISDNGRWLQLDLGNGTTGWVSSAYVISSTVTVTDDGLTGETLRSTARLLIRSEANRLSDRIGLLLRGEDATIIGRSADGNWWQIEFSGITGWVNDVFVLLSPDVDVDSIPITA